MGMDGIVEHALGTLGLPGLGQAGERVGDAGRAVRAAGLDPAELHPGVVGHPGAEDEASRAAGSDEPAAGNAWLACAAAARSCTSRRTLTR